MMDKYLRLLMGAYKSCTARDVALRRGPCCVRKGKLEQINLIG